MKKSVFKKAFQSLYKLEGVAPRRVSFAEIEDLVVIRMKNTLDEGLDPDCAMLLRILLQLISPYGLQYSFQYMTIPESNKIESVSFNIPKREYAKLDNILKPSSVHGGINGE